MTVIHIRDRVTAEQQQFDTHAFSDKSLLLLEHSTLAESFSVELTVGESWSENYGPANNHMYRIDEDQGVEIERNGSIVIEVAEYIRVPHNMYGIVVPTGSLFLDRGIIIAAAKVEPSFDGKLKLRLVNTTSRKVTLKQGNKVASIIFLSTETTSHQPPVEKGAILDKKPPGAGKIALNWLKANHMTVIGWIVTIMVSAVMATFLSLYILAPNSDSPAEDGRAAQSVEKQLIKR